MEGEQMSNQKKKGFMQGLITGIAVMVVLGGVFMLGSQFGKGSESNTLADANQPAPTAPTAPSQPEADPSKVPSVTKDDHIRGDANAKVTMIEYSDFQCPFCLQFHTTMQQVLADYKGKVRLVYRQFPLQSIHPQAQKAAEASECASEQGKFWEMHDKLFELNGAGTLTLDNMKKAATEIKLSTSQFNSCLDTGKYANAVNEDYQGGLSAGVNGTPGTFINTQFVAGALPYAQIKTVIDQMLAS